MAQSSPNKNSTPKSPITPVATSPRFHASASTSSAQRIIGIAVDLSGESAFAVRWTVQNYLREGDSVILINVRPTSVLYGADWGAMDLSISQEDGEEEPEYILAHGSEAKSRHSAASQQKTEEDLDVLTNTKANALAGPLVEAGIQFKIHLVKDHDMKERLCLEAERLGLSALVMGSRGFGAAKRCSKSLLGSVSDYCVHHCICPVIVVRYSEDDGGRCSKMDA